MKLCFTRLLPEIKFNTFMSWAEEFRLDNMTVDGESVVGDKLTKTEHCFAIKNACQLRSIKCILVLSVLPWYFGWLNTEKERSLSDIARRHMLIMIFTYFTISISLRSETQLLQSNLTCCVFYFSVWACTQFPPLQRQIFKICHLTLKSEFNDLSNL